MSKGSQKTGKPASSAQAPTAKAAPAKRTTTAPKATGLRPKSGAAAEKAAPAKASAKAKPASPAPKASKSAPAAPAAPASLAPASAAPQAGDQAPAFSLPALGGETLALAKLKGKQVVLYFYPKDDTPACTQEAIDFSEKAQEFKALGAVVVGVSRDSLADHEKFAGKRKLRVQLASDADGKASEAYGVWVQKSMYGKTYMGLERATFLIGADGVLKRVWRKVKVNGHVGEVLAAVRKEAGES